MNDVIVRVVNLPLSAKGFVATSPDGAYNVYLNARQSYETQRHNYEHELNHINNGDLESEMHILDIEQLNS